MRITEADRKILDSPRHALLMQLDEISELLEYAEGAQLEELNAQYNDIHVAIERLEG